jgi:hypothetical protein
MLPCQEKHLKTLTVFKIIKGVVCVSAHRREHAYGPAKSLLHPLLKLRYGTDPDRILLPFGF